MNDAEIQKKRNDIRRLFRHQSGIHVNCVRLNKSNTWKHEMLKLKVCWWLLEQGKEFICEAESHDKKQRCDIVDLDGQIYEIVVSEGEASLLRKSKEYPLPITIVRWADGAAEKYKPLEKVG